MPEKNKECKCPYDCSRHGDCEACLAYHKKTGSRTNCGKDGSEKENNGG